MFYSPLVGVNQTFRTAAPAVPHCNINARTGRNKHPEQNIRSPTITMLPRVWWHTIFFDLRFGTHTIAFVRFITFHPLLGRVDRLVFVVPIRCSLKSYRHLLNCPYPMGGILRSCRLVLYISHPDASRLPP